MQKRVTYLSGACERLVVLLFVAWVHIVSGQAPPAYSKVADIYFGIIEPPVVAQHDITIRAPTSNQQLEPKPLECSGIAWVDGYLIMSSDRHDHVVFTCPIDLDRMIIGEPQPYVVIRNEQELLRDAECITIARQPDGKAVVYVMCSLGNDRYEQPLPGRQRMLRFTINRTDPFTVHSPTIFNAWAIRDSVNKHFKANGVQPYRTYCGGCPGPDKNTYRWGHVEGITFTPDGSLMLFGMRNPLHEGNAFLFTVKGVDEAISTKDPTQLELVDLFMLDLGDRGISDLSWDPVTRGYLITAVKSHGPKLSRDQPFPPQDLDSALFWWSGRKKEKPVLFARMPDMTVETICRLGSSRFVAIGSDEGDISEGREQRQSILTIIDFTGVPQGR